MSETRVEDKQFIFFIVAPISISYYPNCRFENIISPIFALVSSTSIFLYNILIELDIPMKLASLIQMWLPGTYC